ncbi:hypothetical protein J6590_073058 [Homalodisca vitripennis]|nr:hypothetical protein J6590_092265 [Homalodisca vitripennis]KAG8320237.1 hypothetical protein J6590_073058 [Homalodisca vitripennis]
MTLSAQLESLRRQKSALNKDSHGGSSQSVGTPSKPESGEFSFLRRKLAQFRSGKWKRSLDGSSMVRSQSWNHGLHTTSKLQSEWSSSLTSLQENEVVDATSTKQPQPVDKDKDRKPLTRSQSVYHKVPPPEVVKFRRSSQVTEEHSQKIRTKKPKYQRPGRRTACKERIAQQRSVTHASSSHAYRCLVGYLAVDIVGKIESFDSKCFSTGCFPYGQDTVRYGSEQLTSFQIFQIFSDNGELCQTRIPYRKRP